MNQPEANIVITGMGLVTCLGLDAPSTWRAVLARRSGAGPLSALEPAPPGAAAADIPWRGGQAPDAPGAADGAPREVHLLRMAMHEAWRDARLGDRAPYPADRCGYALGTTLHGMRQGGAYLRSEDPRRFDRFLAGATLRDATRDLYPRGPMLTTCAACSSGLGSIGLAMTLLRAGVLDLVIAGGYDPISEYAYAGFSSLRLIAAGATRPFCKDRDGMMIAEGYAVVVLERADDAGARGARPVAWVRAVGKSSDAHHLTQPHPEGEGALRAIRAALAGAGTRPDEIGLVSAHATGTPNNDAAEVAALAAALGDRLSRTPVVAFKTHIGHALGGAGAAELVLSASALRDQVVPPTANVNPAEVEFPALDLNTGEPRRAAIQATLNLSLGFGGANTCAVLAAPARMGASGPSRESPLREAVITGIGVILPGAVGNEQFVARMEAGDAAAPCAGPVAEEQYAHLLNARRVRRMSDYVKLTLGATSAAFADARIDDPEAFARGCCAILGTTHGSTGYCEQYYTQIVKEGMAAANPMLFAEGVPNAAAAQLSMMFQVQGFCQTIVGTRTAGIDALWLAALRVATGKWDRAIVSAGEEYSALVDRAYRCQGLGADSAGAPFASSEGFVTAAGAVTFILESRASATARRARVLGTILRGTALSTPRLAGRDGISCVRRVLESIGGPSHIISSANGTWLDRVEATGIAGARRGRSPAVVSSITGYVGETFSVGALAAIASVLLKGKGLPPLLSPWRGRPGRTVPAAAGNSGSEFAVVWSDYAGAVSAVAARCEKHQP